MNIVNSSSFVVDLVDDYNMIQELILPNEPTVAQNITTQLTKVLVITCASYYEQKLQNAYIAYAQRESDLYSGKPHGFDIFKNDKKEKSVYQKFSFGRIDDPNDNKQLPELKNLLDPLKFFGDKFRDRIYDEVNKDVDKEKQAKAFQEIFAIRNLIAHQAYVELTSNSIRGKSFLDIKGLHDDAITFVNYLVSQFA